MESSNGVSSADYKSEEDTVQCVVIVNGGSHPAEPIKYYGPFVNFDAALKWTRQQPGYVGFAICPIRTPHKSRIYDDFYLPARLEKDDSDFVEV